MDEITERLLKTLNEQRVQIEKLTLQVRKHNETVGVFKQFLSELQTLPGNSPSELSSWRDRVVNAIEQLDTSE